jgi:hypothetical protein
MVDLLFREIKCKYMCFRDVHIMVDLMLGWMWMRNVRTLMHEPCIKD